MQLEQHGGRHLGVSDLRGAARLAIAAMNGLTDLVEAMHARIAPLGAIRRTPRTRGLTGLVYGSIRGVTRLVGGGLEMGLGSIETLAPTGESQSSLEREAALAVLNGVLGDHLAASANPLALAMEVRHQGRTLTLERVALRAAIPEASRRLAVLVHGLCRNDHQWSRPGATAGVDLFRGLDATPLALRYNSGLHVSTNGRAFAALLETLIEQWPVPVEEILIIGHSMGGLVARSACHYGERAEHRWSRRLCKLVFLGTPHHGVPLERGGQWVHLLLGAAPYAAPLARLGTIRSAGITDLRHGNLVDEDWEGRDRFARAGDGRRHVPLPRCVACYTIAAATGERPRALRDRLWGDGLVPVDSALGRHPDPDRSLSFPASRKWIVYGANHFDLLRRPSVAERIRGWLAA
ncbi:MAG: lipase family alpha/beta hydrolase [Acidobacteriota bacterium]